jgi:LmbE family N-acetylglucosaminyl deacetylase
VRALHLAPHPDDEVLGAGATLLALSRAGHEVTNLAVSLGRRAERERRSSELEAACERLGIGLRVLDPPLDLSVGEGDDLIAAERRLALELSDAAAGADLLIAPSLDDAHPGHGMVARAALTAMAPNSRRAPRLWLWSVWSTLRHPTAMTVFDEATMEQLERALEEHRSQLERNNYPRLLRGRAMAAAVLGPELLFGSGSAGLESPFAELICEVASVEGRWLFGTPRTLDPEKPLPPPSGKEAWPPEERS